MKQLLASCAVLAFAVALAPQAQAQTAPPPSAAGPENNITVTGHVRPQAEAPRSATCEVMMLDPSVRAQIEMSGGNALLGPTIYIPTRAPRTPDYAAPPLTPVGSALPDLPKSRFGIGAILLGESNEMGVYESNAVGYFPETAGLERGGRADAPAQPSSGAIFGSEFTREDAVASCRAMYSRGGSFTSFPGTGSNDLGGNDRGRGNDPLVSTNRRFDRGRAEIVRRDTSLPMAFALFDQRRFAESLEWFHRAESKLQPHEGGDEAALFIGKLHLHGTGDLADPAEGVKWLKRAAEARFNPTTDMPQFNPRRPELNTAMGEAAVILGNLYRTGFGGVAKDLDEARKWYARALEVGHIPAAKVLGDMHFRGVGVARDVRKAMSFYKKAAEYGLPDAQFALAEIHYLGDDGVTPNAEEALRWYQAAARFDHPGALHALGRAYELGEGVEADPQMAIGFYKTAALRGSPAALAALGVSFYEGNVVPKDHQTARLWFEEAAKGADPEGMFNLAAMMARGEGGPKDVVRSWVLLQRAAALGNSAAPTVLAAVERQMSPAERQAAAEMLSN